MNLFWKLFSGFMVVLTIATIIGLLVFQVFRVPIPSWPFANDNKHNAPIPVKPLEDFEQKLVAGAIADYYINSQRGVEGYDVMDHISKLTVLKNDPEGKKICVSYTFVHVPDQRVLSGSYGTSANANFYLEKTKEGLITNHSEAVDSCPSDDHTTVVEPELVLQTTPDDEQIIGMIKTHVAYQINFVKSTIVTTSQNARNYIETCATVVGYSGNPNELFYVLVFKNHKWEVIDGYHRRDC